ncbi:hypothetical protein THAOC_08547 [Thalassiosira oceanica]|uniref:Uncharacterized protein n=1 Tax=Thalassiosira oceanica TaxID=159749 RepID=K0T9M3_THAOC|nr:hypothetical protein THAOC_08547 [Thalassiosira oceanica]|eukprot:EJK70121.1 hypothetical protein THAOC_08547 [Thalassiosira oceanica]
MKDSWRTAIVVLMLGNVVEHLEGILPLDVVVLDLRHADVEYVPDTSLKERLNCGCNSLGSREGGGLGMTKPNPTPPSGNTKKTTDQILKEADMVESNFRDTIQEGRTIISSNIVPDASPEVVPAPEHPDVAMTPDGAFQLSRNSMTSLQQMLQDTEERLQETREDIQRTFDNLNKASNESAVPSYNNLMRQLQGHDLGVSPPAPAPDENPGQDDPIVGRLVDGDGKDDYSAIKDDASALENKKHVPDELTRPASNGRDPTPDPHRPKPDTGQSIPLFRPRHQPRVTSTTGTGGGSHTGCLLGARGVTNGRDTTNAATNSPGGMSHRFPNVTLRPHRRHSDRERHETRGSAGGNRRTTFLCDHVYLEEDTHESRSIERIRDNERSGE